MKRIALALAALQLIVAQPAAAASTVPDNPQIDYQGFVALATAVGAQRPQRLVPLARFLALAGSGEALLLDARSARDFAAGHIAGAVNLPLPEFTAASLAATIGPDRDRPVLIYCNNNFSNDAAPVVRKRAELALNIQTMINLYGYGYRNVHELGEVVDFTERRVPWVAQAAAD